MFNVWLPLINALRSETCLTLAAFAQVLGEVGGAVELLPDFCRPFACLLASCELTLSLPMRGRAGVCA